MSSAKWGSSSKKTVKYKTYSVWRCCCMFCFSSLHGSWKSQSLICTLMIVKEELLLLKKKEKKVGTQQWQCPPTPTSVYFTPWRILLSQRTKTVKMLLGCLVYNDWGGCFFFFFFSGTPTYSVMGTLTKHHNMYVYADHWWHIKLKHMLVGLNDTEAFPCTRYPHTWRRHQSICAWGFILSNAPDSSERSPASCLTDEQLNSSKRARDRFPRRLSQVTWH